MSVAQLPQSADVVVIGGGIIGCSVAYHLLQLGAGHVVVLEREETLAAQTTFAGAGFIATWSGSAKGSGEPELWLEHYGLAFYRALAQRHDIGLKAVGMIWVAGSPESAGEQQAQYRRALTHISADDVALLTPQQVVEAAPIVAEGQIYGGLHWRNAMRVSAPQATHALGRDLLAAGAQIYTGVEVTGIASAPGCVTAVHTTTGSIATNRVVNAAGAWVPEIARMAGGSLPPLLPLQATRFVTEPLPEVPADLPLLMFPDYHGLYVREEEGSLLIGSEEIVVHPPTLMRVLESALGYRSDKGAANTALTTAHVSSSNTHRYHRMLAKEFAHTLPVLGRAAVREVRHGWPTRTLDLRHLLGQDPHVSGFYSVGADCEIGLTHGPGLGRLAAELVLHKCASADSWAYRIDRWQ